LTKKAILLNMVLEKGVSDDDMRNERLRGQKGTAKKERGAKKRQKG
jgi:hypothetical protein